MVAFSIIISTQIGLNTGYLMDSMYSWSQFDQNNMLDLHFMKTELQQIQTSSGIYNFLLKLQTERLWKKIDQNSPYRPVGTTRLMQQRVEVPPDCKSFFDWYNALPEQDACRIENIMTKDQVVKVAEVEYQKLVDLEG